MQKIVCPSCGESFELDETSLDNIISQIHNNEFEKEVEKRTQQIKENLSKDIDLVKADAENEKQIKLTEKDSEIASLKAEIESAKIKSELEINKEKNAAKELKTELDNISAQIENEKQLAVNEAVSDIKTECEKLKMELSQLKREKENSEKALIEKHETEKQLAVTNAVANAEKEREQLKMQLSQLEAEKENSEKTLTAQHELEKQQAVSLVEKERDELKIKVEATEKEKAQSEQQLKEQYEEKIRDKDAQIEYFKDFKIKLSTKGIGESLEKYCMDEFNKIRMTAFPSAYFEKDNDAKSGSKGDFIFREEDNSGAELISIMFEMKNENETTATKHKNEDFFKELDKDRREKNCEYAVLVTMLEADNDFYNNGIVDVSYRYPKMYVIRPQFFIAIIGLLRNAALGSLQYKRELMAVRQMDIDVTDFEEKIEEFKSKFGRDCRLANDKFSKAIDEIDKSIKALEKVKENLLGTTRSLELAEKKTDDLTIRKLTKGNSTMSAKFLAIEAEKQGKDTE